MDKFIARENVKRFKEQLKNCSDDHQRVILQQLLAEHEQHLAAAEGRPAAASSSRAATNS